MTKKFELTAETKDFLGIKLFRIRALIEFGDVAKGDLGGWVESEKNLAHDGDAWVSDDAKVSGEAKVFGHAKVSGRAWVSGEAWVYGHAKVSGRAWVSGEARVASPISCATRSDGYIFTIVATPQGARIIAGCRYFSFAEARAHWTGTRGGTPLGDESLAIVDCLERLATIRGFIKPVKGDA